MTFKERMNLLLHKEECMRVIMFDEAKRGSSRVIRVSRGQQYIRLKDDETSYVIDSNKIQNMGGLPTLIYHFSNAVAIDPMESKSEDMSSQKLDKIFRTKIIQEMIHSAEEEGMTLKNLIFIAMGITIVVLGIGMYLLYKEITAVNEYIEANKDVIDLIKDYLLQNGGN